MKNGEAKRKQPSTPAPRAARDVAAGAPKQAPKEAPKEARRVPPEPPRAAAAPNGDAPLPDLTKYGVSEPEARSHLRQCEPCGRAHKHVVKNPKDVMALDAFGRHIATCLAVQGDKAHA
jgi:hypothetical protein